MAVATRVEGRRIVVTGGCGFIGSHLVRRLLSDGAREVVVVDSLRYGQRENLEPLDPRVRIVQHRLGHDTIGELRPHLDGAACLLHLAAEKHNQSKDTPRQVIDANVTGSFELFDLAGKVGVERCLFTSSLYAYGRMTGSDMRESDVPSPCTVYGISKLAGEHLLELAAAQSGMKSAIVRYFFIYGPRQFAGLGYKSVIVKNFERIARGEPPIVFGSGEQTLDYLYVDDAVEATLRALLSDGLPRALNVGSGVGISVNELTAAMLEVADSRLAPVHGPADWTEGTRRVGDVGHAKRALDWEPEVDLRTGLLRTFEWVRAGGAA